MRSVASTLILVETPPVAPVKEIEGREGGGGNESRTKEGGEGRGVA